MRVLFLASGGGSTAKKLYDLSQISKYDVFKNIEIQILADRDCGASQWAEEKSLPHLTIGKKDFESKSIDWIIKRKPDIVVTTIYKILSKEFIEAVSSNLINLHYSLLPAFNGGIGEKVVDDAIQYGSRIFGATCHQVTELVDLGKPITQAAFIPTKLNRNHILEISFRCGCIALFSAINNIHFMDNKKIRTGQIILKDELIIYSGEDKYISQLKEDFW